MRLLNLIARCVGTCVALCCLATRASAYFVITEPTRDSQWVNGIANPVTWQKGVLDGIDTFDVEMARLSQDGLTFVAKNVPATASSINIVLQDFPAGDDYFLVLINSTHGVMHATSPRFAILPSSSSAKSSQPSAVANVETVTVSGAPNPTRPFATTFPALSSNGFASWGSAGQAWGLSSVLAGCLVGATWTLW